MGWNQARISMVPQDAAWNVEDGIPRDSERRPVPIIHTSSTAATIDRTNFELWLQSNGFQHCERTTVSTEYRRDDIELFLSLAGGQFHEVILTFRLQPEAYKRVGIWHQFVERLNQEWGLDIQDWRRKCLVNVCEYPRVLMETPAWREFAESYKWPPPGNASVDVPDAQSLLNDAETDRAFEMLPLLDEYWATGEAA